MEKLTMFLKNRQNLSAKPCAFSRVFMQNQSTHGVNIFVLQVESS